MKALFKIKKNIDYKEVTGISVFISVSNMIFHMIYMLLFFLMDIKPLLIFNGCCVIISLIIAILCMKNPYYLFGISALGYLHVVFAIYVLGLGYGFMLFFFSIIPITFFIFFIYKAKNYLSIVIVSISFLTYMIMLILSDVGILNIQIEISSFSGMVLTAYNSIITFISITAVSVIFVRRITNKEVGLEDQNKRLSKLANVDPLTELLNRRSINQKLELSMQRKINLNVDFTVAIADIDNFKDLNDKYGHDCGDRVLKNIAEEIKGTVRDTDYVCRWGGEEILILFCGSGQESSGRVLERIRKNIEINGGLYGEARIGVTMTFGVSSSEKFSSVKEIILKADENLYHGKKSGKNCIVYS